MIPLEAARWKLGILWFSAAALIFVLLIVQTISGVYENSTKAVWGWSLPNLMPTLSLMIGVFAGAALGDNAPADRMRVRRGFFRFALALSAFYLACLLVPLLVFPFAPSLLIGEQEMDPKAWFDQSNLWLGPLQGLVAAALSALFFTKGRAPNNP